MRISPPSRAACTLSVVIVLLVASTIGAQQLSGTANSSDQTTAKLVADMISKYHISQKHIDDRISQLLLKRLLKDLDPQKLYFLQSDIDVFSKYRDQLDDMIAIGNVDFARQVFDVYLRRLDERMAMAHKLIDTPHDFTVDESLTVDGDKLAWAASSTELDDRWRKRIKYDLLSLKLEKLDKSDKPVVEKPVEKPVEEPTKRLHKRYDTIKRNAHDTEDGEILEMYLSSLAHCFDPHSSYMSPNTLDDFNIQMRLSLEGIGAALRSEDGYTTVAQIVAGGAAEKDGRLKVGDKITAVKQSDGDWVDIVEMKLTKVVRQIRGKEGTTVNLRVVNVAGETTELALVRQKIELTSSEVKGEIIDVGTKIPGLKGKVGVINIPSFYRDFGGAQQGLDDFKSAARDVAKVLQSFKAAGGVECVVVDLRMNGGGALAEAIELSGLFIDQGPVVQVKEQNGKIKGHDDTEAGLLYDGPVVVLCNRLSASASEIFAAAIKDYHRGIVVGDATTHGKGTVQNVMPVQNQMFRVLGNSTNRGALKLTINQFYRVNGDSTQNRGVESDVVLPSLLDHMDLGESSLENALAFDRVEPARHVIYDVVTPGIVASLKDTSTRRVAADTKFTEIQKDIDRYVERKNRKSVSLNEEQLRKEREADKAAEDVAKAEEDKETKGIDGPIFPDNEYNKEVLNIAVDYVQLLRQAKTAAR
ncbi:MAG: carboxy terminal-processing peptidase [Planctomycetaceae bacterium]|nr:carboxy terminal-processing peptidase [Planctomycetaceae bacterium]